LNTVGGEHTAERSAALLSLASSCSLSEILSAQQQALEQIHTQIHLAQQFESITNRLDAIERTLNSLISQRSGEEHHVESPSVAAPTSLLETPTGVTPPMSCITVQTAGGTNPLGSVEKKTKKLPRDLCSKIRALYNSMGLEFNINERFASPHNQRITDALVERIIQDHINYDSKDIKRAAHRYYESRRRIGIEDMPEHKEKAALQKKKRKYRARQQRCYDRRSRVVRDTELQYWMNVTPLCMTEESDDSDTDKIVTHKLLWRSQFLNQFVAKIDARLDRQRKPGGSTNIKRERVESTPSSSHPPFNLPKWMISPAYQSIMTTVEGMVGGGAGTPNPQGSVSVQSEGIMSDGGVEVSGDDTTMQFPIVEVQSVQGDDSSDFELPPEMKN
jgi:hypothetical protein